MIKKTRRIHKNNRCLAILAGVMFLYVGSKAGAWNSYFNPISFQPVSAESLAEADDAVDDDNTPRNLNLDYVYVVMQDGNTYLRDADDKEVFGPCGFIFSEFTYATEGEPFRYLDLNGLIGYAKIENDSIVRITEGMFTEASVLNEGNACVKQGDSYYFIDEDGKQFVPGTYQNAYPFWESAGRLARVQNKDSSWSLINTKGEEVLSGFEQIETLPYYTDWGIGIIDGKVVSFVLESMDYDHTAVLHEFEDFSEIEEWVGHTFAAVKSEEGMFGVISLIDGTLVVPTDYYDIQWGYVADGEDTYSKVVAIRCLRDDGCYDMYYEKEY